MRYIMVEVVKSRSLFDKSREYKTSETEMSRISCKGCCRSVEGITCVIVNGETWHEKCLKCERCKRQLSEICYFKAGQFYCKNDYFCIFAPNCSGCFEILLPNDKIRKAKDKFYHLSCYKCHECNQKFLTGDVLHVVDEVKLLCNVDYYKVYGNSVADISISDQCPHIDNTNAIETKDVGKKPEKTSYLSLTKDLTSTVVQSDQKSMSEVENGDDGTLFHSNEPSALPTGNSKRRGPRTTIKPKQLEMLKVAFLMTPKPTRHIREKLADETGLTMRVIQVWFQNRRSKERRIKQITGAGGRRSFPFSEYVGNKYKSLHNSDYLPHYEISLGSNKRKVSYSEFLSNDRLNPYFANDFHQYGVESSELHQSTNSTRSESDVNLYSTSRQTRNAVSECNIQYSIPTNRHFTSYHQTPSSASSNSDYDITDWFP